MKALKTMTAAACILGMSMAAGQAMARNGNGGGTGVCTASMDICSGEPVAIAGIVAVDGIGTGLGMQIQTDSGLVTVYGIGPIRYWSSLDITRPAVGDEVEINANTVTFSDGSVKDIAITVTIGDYQVELRDTDCTPLWRGNGTGQALNISSLNSNYDILAQGSGKGYGPRDGSGNGTGGGPKDGSGHGPGTGDCQLS